MMHICGNIDNIIGKGEEMRLRRVHSALIATALICSMAVTPVLAAPETLEDLQNQQQELENQKSSAQSELSSLQSQLDTLVSKIADLEEQLIAKGEEIIQAEEDLKVAQQKKDEQYEAMKLRIKYMYEAGSGTATMEKVMSSGDISSMLTQAEYSQQVHEYDRAQLQEYANTVQEIEELQQTLETEMANLESLEAQYQSQQEELNATISSKEAQISDLDGMIQEAARKVQAEQERQEEERRRREAEAAAAAQAAAAAAEEQNSETTTETTVENSNESTGNTSSAPEYNASTGNAIVDRAYSKLGCPYVWGAVGPSTFDCSGLVSYCISGSYTRLGTTTTFMGWTRVSDPQPGDICTSATHCGIYIGGGQMIHAPHSGDVVKVGPVQSNMIYVRY